MEGLEENLNDLEEDLQDLNEDLDEIWRNRRWNRMIW